MSYYFLEISESNSRLISEIRYDKELQILVVFLRNHKPEYTVKTYCNVTQQLYFEFINAKSIGKFYLTNIKHKLKTMSETKVVGINQSSDEDSRNIDISINVTKILKEWLTSLESGTFLNLRMKMLPNGKVDQFGQLAFVSQKPPKDFEKDVPKDKKTKWPILGNAIQWPSTQNGTSISDAQNAGTASEAVLEELQF